MAGEGSIQEYEVEKSEAETDISLKKDVEGKLPTEATSNEAPSFVVSRDGGDSTKPTEDNADTVGKSPDTAKFTDITKSPEATKVADKVKNTDAVTVADAVKDAASSKTGGTVKAVPVLDNQSNVVANQKNESKEPTKAEAETLKVPNTYAWLPSGDPHQSLFRNYNFKREFQRNVVEAFLPPWCMILRTETITCLRTAEILLKVSQADRVDIDRLYVLLKSVSISVSKADIFKSMKGLFRSRRRKTYADFLLALAEDENSERRARRGKFNTRECVFYTAIAFLHLENFKANFVADNPRVIFALIPRIMKKILSKTCNTTKSMVKMYILLLKASYSPYVWPVPKWNNDLERLEESLRIKHDIDPHLYLPSAITKGERPRQRKKKKTKSESVYNWNRQRDIDNKIPCLVPNELYYGTPSEIQNINSDIDFYEKFRQCRIKYLTHLQETFDFAAYEHWKKYYQSTVDKVNEKQLYNLYMEYTKCTPFGVTKRPIPHFKQHIEYNEMPEEEVYVPDMFERMMKKHEDKAKAVKRDKEKEQKEKDEKRRKRLLERKARRKRGDKKRSELAGTESSTDTRASSGGKGRRKKGRGRRRRKDGRKGGQGRTFSGQDEESYDSEDDDSDDSSSGSSGSSSEGGRKHSSKHRRGKHSSKDRRGKHSSKDGRHSSKDGGEIGSSKDRKKRSRKRRKKRSSKEGGEGGEGGSSEESYSGSSDESGSDRSGEGKRGSSRDRKRGTSKERGEDGSPEEGDERGTSKERKRRSSKESSESFSSEASSTYSFDTQISGESYSSSASSTYSCSCSVCSCDNSTVMSQVSIHQTSSGRICLSEETPASCEQSSTYDRSSASTVFFYYKKTSSDD